MDDRRLAEIARRQGGVVTAAQTMACGLSRSGIRHRVASGRLFVVRPRAFTLSPHHDADTALWATLLTTDPDAAALSHWTAAQVHGMVRTPARAIHVSVPGAGRWARPGVIVHRPRRLPTDDVVPVRGLRVTSPGRTVLDVAARAADAVVRRLIREGEFLGLLPAGEMQRVVAAHPRHPGAGRVRRVDPATSEEALSQTPLEDVLEGLITVLPLPPPERQVVLQGISGKTYRVDFGWPALRLAAEADSRSAHERASSLTSDRFRDNDLSAIGWLTMRFTAAQLDVGRADSGRQLVAAAANRGWLRAS